MRYMVMDDNGVILSQSNDPAREKRIAETRNMSWEHVSGQIPACHVYETDGTAFRPYPGRTMNYAEDDAR